MAFKQTLYEYLSDGGKCPRKIKKRILGKRIKRYKLKLMLNSVVIGKASKTMYDQTEIYPYPFCPKCGHTGMRGTGNLTTYPEHWERFHCMRCNSIVAYIDNSPFIHALECKEYDYNPVF